MITEEVGLLASLLAGLFSFLSPCVLPLVPAYLSMVTGMTIDELSQGKSSQKRILLSCLLFVFGFSLVFILMGATASAAGKILVRYRSTINLVLGFLVVVMGLFIAGLLRIPRLYREMKFHPRRDLLSPLGPLAVVVMGSAFALGWTPCVGPILSGILVTAAATNSLTRGVILLSVYSLGLGIPFLLTGLFFARAITAFGWIKRNQGKVNAAAGTLLAVMGVLLILDSLGVVTVFA